MSSKVLVTGGAGFIGSNLCEELLRLGHEVIVIDDLSTGKEENLPRGVVFYEASILNNLILVDAMEEIEYVFHVAAIPSVPRSIDNPFVSHEANATGTMRVLLAAKEAGVKRVIYSASSSAYGKNVNPKTETMKADPLSPYALSKLYGEQLCKIFNDVYGLETISLRYFNVFGPKQDPNSAYSAVIPRFIKAMLEDEPPTVYGDGSQSRDFTYIDNVVEANVLAMKARETKGVMVNIGCGKSTSLINVLRLIYEMREGEGVVPPINFEPPRVGDVKDSLADIKRAKHILGYMPQYDLPEGLIKTVEWFKGN